MNSLLTQSQISEVTGIFATHFQLFSSGITNQISVIKQPINIINNTSENVMAGFGSEAMNYNDITYQPVTGMYPAIIIYPKNMKTQQFGQLKFSLEDNQVMIKVEKDAREFITKGKTEAIVIHGVSYNLDLIPTVQNYMSLKYYYFKLTSTR